MISTNNIFSEALNPTIKKSFIQSGKLLGAGAGLGISSVGKTLDYSGKKLYNKLSDKNQKDNQNKK